MTTPEPLDGFAMPEQGYHGGMPQPTSEPATIPVGRSAQTSANSSAPGELPADARDTLWPLSARNPLAQPPRRPHRRAWWIAACALVGLVVVVIAASVTIHQSAKPASVPLTVTEPTNAHPSQLTVGHCLKTLPMGAEISTVVVVPCTSGHKAQIVAAHTFSADSTTGMRPTEAAMRAEILAVCQTLALKDPPDDLSFSAWLPTTQSWQQGDREGFCLARASTLTASLLP